MLGRVLTLLTAIAAIIQALIKQREQHKAKLEQKANEDDLRLIQENPAEFFKKHFGASYVTIHTCEPCAHTCDSDGVCEDGDVPRTGSTTEARVDDSSD